MRNCGITEQSHINAGNASAVCQPGLTVCRISVVLGAGGGEAGQSPHLPEYSVRQLTMPWLKLIALVFLACPWAARAQTKPNLPSATAAAVGIADHAARQRGDRTQVVVLGTAHLRSTPPALGPQAFEPLLIRLAAFKPDQIGVESLSGAQCDYLLTYGFAYDDTAKIYCPDAGPARAQLKLDNAAAEREIEALLSAGMPFDVAQRRRLVALYLAAGEPASAALQWLRLPPVERVANSVLTSELVAQVESYLARRSEDTLIAVPLAVRLGLERIYPVDDHTGDRATGPIDEATYGSNMKRVWSNPQAENRRKLNDEAQERAVASGDMLAWYRWLNSPEAARLAVAGDFGAAAGDTSAQRTGRSYLAYWETRNLRMAANLREVLGRTRANRLLTIVGASHKAYYERYLGVMSDIELLDVEALLK